MTYRAVEMRLERKPLSWDDVRILEECGSWETARLAAKYVLRRERRERRWYRRLARRVFA